MTLRLRPLTDQPDRRHHSRLGEQWRSRADDDIALALAYEAPGILSLSGIPSPAYFAGVLADVATGQTATWAGNEAIRNNHVAIDVNSLAGKGDVVITGDSVDESSQIPVLADTETIEVREVANYQSVKKWLRVTDVTIPAGITSINYDIGALGYYDYGNAPFRVTGYRMQLLRVGGAASLKLELLGIKDLGDKKYEVNTLEDITVDTTGITDGARSERDYTGNQVPDTAFPTIIKIGDFDSHFEDNEHVFESHARDEGIIVRLTHTQIEYVTLTLRARKMNVEEVIR